MITNLSSNINEVIETVLNFLLFYRKILQVQKGIKPLTLNKNKKMRLKNISEKKSYLFAYLSFALLLGCVFILLVLLVRAKSFRKKNKEFKWSQETSFCVIKTI